MSILSWNLSTTPAQAPEYWLLFVDGFACTSLGTLAPYVGAGAYSVDLTKISTKLPIPTDGAPHSYSVALVGDGSCGPQSASISITLPQPSAIVSVGGQQSQQSAVWPAADTLTSA